MGEIQSAHITNNSDQNTNTHGLSIAGNTTLINWDEKFILDSTIAGVPVVHSDMMDGSVSGYRLHPNTFTYDSE